MKKLTPEVAQAFANLRGNHDFSVVLQQMEADLTAERVTCTKADGLPLYRAQGAAGYLDSYLSHFANAPTALKKLKSSN